MAVQSVDLAPVIREADEDDPTVHLVCCMTAKLPTSAFCGEPVTRNLTPPSPFADGDCMACELIHHVDPGFCPILGGCIRRD